jgi:DNA-binding phage protein
MALKPFDLTVAERARSSKNFRNKLLEEATNELINGNFQVAKVLLRHYVNAVISFERLAIETNIHNKSLQRMLGANGNPTSTSLICVLQAIQRIEGIQIKVKII